VKLINHDIIGQCFSNCGFCHFDALHVPQGQESNKKTQNMHCIQLVVPRLLNIRGPFEKYVDWRQCAAVTQSEAVTVMPSCSGGDNVVAASSLSL